MTTLEEVRALEGRRVRLRWTNYRYKGARWRRTLLVLLPKLGWPLVFRPVHNEREGILGITHIVLAPDDLYLLELDGGIATTLADDVEVVELP